MSNAHVTRTADEAVFRFTYDADLIEAFKVRVPYRFRRWDPADKAWTVREPWVETTITMLSEKFGASRVAVTDRRPGAPPPPSGSNEAAEVAKLQRMVAELRRDLNATRVQLRDANIRAGQSTTNGNWAEQLFRELPDGMRDAVYKRLLTALHPDANGGSAQAVELTKKLNGSFRPPKSGR